MLCRVLISQEEGTAVWTDQKKLSATVSDSDYIYPEYLMMCRLLPDMRGKSSEE
jgi:hypothetical protein